MIYACAVSIALTCLAGNDLPLAPAEYAGLRLNEIQVVGTHNSYHLRPPADALKAMIAIRRDARQWDYSRETLDQQLARNIRNFELDLHVVQGQWRVMHVPTLDAGSTVATLDEALGVIRQWSNEHAGHIPVSLLLEIKDEGPRLSRAVRQPTTADFDRLDEQLRTALGERLVTPDEVRGDRDDLPSAVKANGWPTLEKAAGRLLAILHANVENQRLYVAGHEALRGRALFVDCAAGQPHSGVIVLNSPGDPEIGELVRQGYLIRTRADSQGEIVPARREQALACGAHILTTDYPVGEIEPSRAFALPDNAAARVNPMTGPVALRGRALAEPKP